MLPRDLPGALARLDAREVEALLMAVVDEVERRGRLTPAVAKTVADAIGDGEMPKKLPSASSQPDRQGMSRSDGGLTFGQTNAVRAAFAAGVKPSTIARQFGISGVGVEGACGDKPRTDTLKPACRAAMAPSRYSNGRSDALCPLTPLRFRTPQFSAPDGWREP